MTARAPIETIATWNFDLPDWGFDQGWEDDVIACVLASLATAASGAEPPFEVT